MAKIIKLVFTASLFILCSAKVKDNNHDTPGWIKMTELSDKIKSEPKPVIIDLYTDWCYWCKVMDKKTYTSSKVVSYINDHFYAVKLNAETRELVNWNSKEYNFNDTYKVNDFTMYVSGGQPGFPTTVIFANENSEPVAIQGYLPPKDLEPILKYYGEGAYKQQSFSEFRQNFKSKW